MFTFSAEDGYSYLIEVLKDGILQRTYRIDSETVNIILGTFETVNIRRMDVSEEVSRKLGTIRREVKKL